MNKQSVIDGLSKISAVMTRAAVEGGCRRLCGSGSLCGRSRGDRPWKTHDADRKGIQ